LADFLEFASMEVLAAYPRRHPDTAFRQIGDEGGLVVLPGRAEVKVLNPVGIAVFSRLDGSQDLDALAAAVAGEFDIELDRAREDVVEFLKELQREGLLAEGSAAPNERSS
jgi:hypothetical protein